VTQRSKFVVARADLMLVPDPDAGPISDHGHNLTQPRPDSDAKPSNPAAQIKPTR
jgi:hypothetical protein